MTRITRLWVISAIVLIGVFVATPANAQLRRKYWGLSADFVPKLTIPNYQKRLFKADKVDLPSTEFQAGFVRGALYRSYWGFSFLSRNFRNGGSLTRGNATLRADRLRAVGVEIYKFAPFATIRERVQVGMTFGIGAGWLLGSFNEQVPNSPDKTVRSSQLFFLFGKALPVLPTFLLDFTGAALLREDIRIFISAGLHIPGEQHLLIGATYLFGVR